jgi:uncharacterized protein YggE
MRPKLAQDSLNIKERNDMRNLPIFFLGLMIAIAAVLPGTGAENQNVSKLISNGEGKATAVPDLTIITLGVETRNVSAASAVSENAVLMNSTINALLAAGLKKKDIQTSRYTLSTRAEENPRLTSDSGVQKNETPPEFIATNQVTARMNVTDDVGKVLDAAIAAGSNNVMGISFDLLSPKPQMDKALADAIEDSKRKAEVMADAAGVKLGRILEISEGYSFTSSIAPRAAAYSLAEAPTSVLPGEMEVTAQVTVTYEIEAA